MASVMEQHIPGEQLPLAMETDRSASSADEELILLVLAAVSLQLEGTNTPIKKYLRRYECGDASESHTKVHKGNHEEELKRSAGSQPDCANTPIQSYLRKYRYEKESESFRESEDPHYDYKQQRGLREQEFQ